MPESLLRLPAFDLSTSRAMLHASGIELGAGGPRRNAAGGGSAETDVVGIVGFAVLIILAVASSIAFAFLIRNAIRRSQRKPFEAAVRALGGSLGPTRFVGFSAQVAYGGRAVALDVTYPGRHNPSRLTIRVPSSRQEAFKVLGPPSSIESFVTTLVGATPIVPGGPLGGVRIVRPTEPDVAVRLCMESAHAVTAALEPRDDSAASLEFSPGLAERHVIGRVMAISATELATHVRCLVEVVDAFEGRP